MSVQRLALISVHASPLAPMGGKKTGGMNIYVRKVAQEFAGRGIQVDVFTRKTESAQPAVDTSLGENLRVINISAGVPCSIAPDEIFSHLPEFTAGVIAYATRHTVEYDLIYSHYWLSGWVASKLREIWGTPFVQMFHTLGHMKNRVLSIDSDVSPNQRIRVETEIAEQADRIIAATPAEYTQLRWLYRANRRKIGVISPGVDLQRFQAKPVAEARHQLGLDEHKHIVLFVGRIDSVKAIDTLIRALPLVRDTAPHIYDNLQLLVVGGDPDPAADSELLELTDLVEDLEIAQHVNFIAAQDHDNLMPYYASASLLVLPSIYESFGMAALEAMATGTPVIASAVGGLTYLVEDGVTGYLIPSRDPIALAERIVTLLSLSTEQYTEMRQAALDRAQEYAWSRIVDDLLATFEEVLVGGATSPHRN